MPPVPPVLHQLLYLKSWELKLKSCFPDYYCFFVESCLNDLVPSSALYHQLIAFDSLQNTDQDDSKKIQCRRAAQNERKSYYISEKKIFFIFKNNLISNLIISFIINKLNIETQKKNASVCQYQYKKYQDTTDLFSSQNFFLHTGNKITALT